ncbi:hypothetical protein K458DRAFT_184440 [Lentithecium fluviatile CBS 122367]|uniref:DUF7137 domain-containing protein n=1 Tax=Lentithecium fluviatile CBS 122367 TaxID=1168545 RepID=A0A6G1J9W4_9PLEO|nr:hypothetical protein K458DRAFT_184440 [Lentithecium fluviatile CBS 122367]
MRPSQLLAAVVALSSVTAAWPDVFGNAPALGDINNIIYGRQDNTESANSETTSDAKTTDAPTSTGDAKTTGSDKTTATNSDESKTTDKASGSGASTGSKGATKTSSGKPKVTNFGDDVPAGGIAMVTPGVFDGTQYYKIGDWVHLAWNYTSLSMTPSAVDVLATCTANQATYTLAVNQSVKATGEVFWNTGTYKDDHPNGAELLTEMYTLMIYDSNTSVTAAAKPGYLSPYKTWTFGMYSPQPYTPWASFKCANCNAALSPFEQLTLKAIMLTSTTTIASLLYFTASFGVW